METALLEMIDIEKRFHGFKALKDVNLKVDKGTIHAIVGENGAGKSTLMNILSGVYPYPSYSGTLLYNNQLQRFKSINESEREGIQIIHQELELVNELSIQENIFLGNEKSRLGVIDWDAQNKEAKELLGTVGLQEDTSVLVKHLGVGKQQLVEIAKALSKEIELLIMDEPTAALNDNDSARLLDLIKRLRIEKKLTVIIISHKLDEVLKISDYITVLRDGKTIETFKNDKTVTKNRIIKSMVGREIENLYPPRVSEKNEIALQVKDWTVFSPTVKDRKIIDKVDLKVHYGEIVGIAGLMGAGRTELALSLFGKSYGHSITGEVFKNNKTISLNNVTDAIRYGIAYVPEDRKESGLIMTDSILKNISLPSLKKFSSKGIMDEDQEFDAANYFSTSSL